VREVFEIVYLLAALQGLLLSVFLFTKKENHTANLVLGVATLALSLELATVVYYSKGWYKIVPHAMGFTYPFPALYGPLFFLYAKLISNKEKRLHGVDFLHFIPFLLIYCITAPIFFYSGQQKIVFLNNMLRNIHHPAFSVFDLFISIQGIVYTVFTLKVVAAYNRSIKDSYSNIDLINLNWLKYLAIGGAIIWSIVAFGMIGREFGLYYANFSATLNIPLAILIYSIGYMGLKQPVIFASPLAAPDGPPVSEKYRKSGLSEGDAEVLKQSLLNAMEKEKPYLDNELTLQRLAERLNASPHNLSEVINSQLHQSYYDFINSYRVEEFKARIANPANDRYNLLSIAFDSGFKSKGTFNAIFKKSTGATPSAYKERLNLRSK
jgi:AraC-like DNA-binding protein